MGGVSVPGWYPDPSSRGQYRYWDGRAWTGQTTNPDGSTTPTAGGPSRKPWVWFLLAMLVVGALVAVLLLRPGSGFGTVPEDTNSSRPTGSQWNEQEPTETPSNPDATGHGELVDCPTDSTDYFSEVGPDGRMHGGGLSFTALTDGWRSEPVYMPWLYDHNSQTKTIRSGWFSNLSVGQVKKSEGFTSPRQTTASLMECIASSGLFMGFSGREDLRDEGFNLGDKVGWRITADVFVDNQGDILGDVVDIIVLDLGDPDHFSVFISCATIDHQSNLAEVERATESLRIE